MAKYSINQYLQVNDKFRQEVKAITKKFANFEAKKHVNFSGNVKEIIEKDGYEAVYVFDTKEYTAFAERFLEICK